MTLRPFKRRSSALLAIAIAVAALGSLGCRVTLRLAPSVTIDTQGKPGLQALVGVGLMGLGEGDDAKGLALAALGGAYERFGDLHATSVAEAAVDYYVVPMPADSPRAVPANGSASTSPSDSSGGSGPAARAGGRLGVRIPEGGGKAQQAIGAAGAVAWRFGTNFLHFVSVEGRADYVGGSPGYGVFAVGPHYELASPALRSAGGR